MVESGILKIESMKNRCTPAEWQARVDLAACYRLVDIYGMSDMMANHVSCSVPGEEGGTIGSKIAVGLLTPADLEKVARSGKTVREGIGMSVVAAFKLDELAAACGAACQAHCAHTGLGARADQANHFHRGHQLEQSFDQFNFPLGRCAKRKTIERGFLHGF